MHLTENRTMRRLMRLVGVMLLTGYFAARAADKQAAAVKEPPKAGPALTAVPKANATAAAVFEAAYKGDVAIVEEMLEANPALLEARALDGRRPLHFAVSGGLTEVVKLLLAHGARVDSTDMFGITPLHVAAVKGQVEVAEVLLKHGAPVNARHRYGKTPLGAAIYMNCKPMIDLLRRYGGKE
jgi:ankyrin repeat protein